jgi:UDP-2,3-diacylglucosamine hydrolase
MCGAGVLPARMAGQARRQGWRVVAFTFGEAPGVTAHAERTVPAVLNEAGAVVAALASEQIGSVLFSGKFWMRDYFHGGRPDAAVTEITAKAGALVDTNLVQAVVSTLGQMGITLLDQRPFLGDWLAGSGCWSARDLSEVERNDVQRGLAVARLVADAGIGQTVVVKQGAVMAVEASEGTTEAIRRGVAYAGPGALVVKAVARDHDYRFDTPTIGPDTVAAAAAGGATVVAVEADRVLILERDECVRIADGAGLVLTGIA